MLSKIDKIFFSNNENQDIQWNFFIYAILLVLTPILLIYNFFITPMIPVFIRDIVENKNPILNHYFKVYPVIVEHQTFSEFKENQIPVYSSITSGGSGGITKDLGFHTLSRYDEFYISYSSNFIGDSNNYSKNTTKENKNNLENSHQTENGISNQSFNTSYSSKNTKKEENNIPNKIPANYRFRNNFALRWDHSPQFAISSVELIGYKYFRDMLRQIRENFSPPGLNLVWRDSAGIIVSQPIKPQIVQVLFLLDYDGTVRDVKIVSSMGQKPVDEACIRALLNQNFGTPPPEIFKHGNIFGINFIFPPIH